MAGFNQQVQVLFTYVSIFNVRIHGYLWPTKVMPDNKMDMVFKTCVQLQNLIQPVLTKELNSCLPM